METVLLAMVAFAPWAYGAEPPGFEFLLDAGVSLLVVLWGLRMVLAGEVTWANCPVTLCLAALFVLGTWQVTPLNRTVLAYLSPATAHLYEKLLPSQPERMSAADGKAVADSAAGFTISLYPHTTRRQLLRLLAVFLVFAVVRNNLGSSRCLRRLAIVVLINGGLLSLFAFLQFFSSPPELLYWTYPAGGRVFGPFMYRNHYACYVNLCIGLGLGLLWSRRRSLSPLRLLQDPAALWICLALVLMVSSVPFSLSRGGFLALVCGFGVCFLMRISGSAGSFRPGAILLCLALAVGLLGWLGLPRIEARLATLWGGKALQESRLSLWAGAWNIIADFPVWGTGYGTYQYVDPLYRTNAEVADLSVDHPHNDYLEVLAESGTVGLFLGLLASGLVFSFGYRAIRKGNSKSGLALGALFAFTTLLIQCIGDFDVHVPAITLLATVLCAQLCALNASESVSSPDVTDLVPSSGRWYRLRWRGLAPLLGAATCVGLGLLVFNGGWKAHKLEMLRLAAFRAGQNTEAGSLELKKDYLEAAARLIPDDANLRTELGEAYADLFRQEKEALVLRNKAGTIAGAVLSGSSADAFWGGTHALPVLPSLLMTARGRRQSEAVEEQRLTCRYLLPALHNFVQGRDQCPLLPGPHLGLALDSGKMARAEPFSVYMDRVQLLAPADPTFWYYCGNQELFHGHHNRAWKSWRRCLKLSDRYLPTILDSGAKLLGPEGLVREVIPDVPDLLLTAALRLYPRADATAERTPFLQKALHLLSVKGAALTSTDLHTKALAHKSLGQTSAALGSYRVLLAQQPLQIAWRYELAQLLYGAGRLKEARIELLTVLARQPRHEHAYELLKDVTNGLLRRH